MPEVVELERAAAAGLAVGDRVAVEEHLDRADVAGEVAGVGVGLGQRERGDPRVVLGRAGVECPSQACSSNSDIGSFAL